MERYRRHVAARPRRFRDAHQPRNDGGCIRQQIHWGQSHSSSETTSAAYLHLSHLLFSWSTRFHLITVASLSLFNGGIKFSTERTSAYLLLQCQRCKIWCYWEECVYVWQTSGVRFGCRCSPVLPSSPRVESCLDEAELDLAGSRHAFGCLK